MKGLNTMGNITSAIEYIPTEQLHPHPDNPRRSVGDVTELADSIKVNGVLQNLTVVPREPDGYTVLIGHRRLAAAKKAGVESVPCVVTEMSPQQQVKTMLMENIQRSDLTVYEQAQGFQLMLDMGETVESIAKESGFSQTTVRRRVKLLELDAEKFRKSEARGATLQDYLELDKIEDPELKNKALDAVGTVNFRDVLKKSIEDDKHKRRMAQWETDLEAFAVKIEKRDYVGEAHTLMDYVRNYGRWSNKDTLVERPDDAGEVKYYYRVGNDQIDLFKDHQERVETEEDRERKRREEANNRIEAELEEITERHFSIRCDFVSEFGTAKKHSQEIIGYAAEALVGNGGWSRDTMDTDLLTELLDLDTDENTTYPELKAMVAEQAKQAPEYTLLVCAYATVDGDGEGYWDRKWNSDIREYEFTYKPNEDLDRLYALLASLGYEMSDEEKAMQNGTHELFQKHREVDPCTHCKSAHPYCDKCCKVCEERCNGAQECCKESGVQG